MKTLCFTGHRPNKLGGYKPDAILNMKVKAALSLAINEFADKHGRNNVSFITGMALGVDQWAADILIDEDLPFIAAIPCKGQESQWPEKAQDHYHFILSLATQVVCLAEKYTHECMNDRNRWMVDHADHVLAIWDGTPGGTGQCVGYAQHARHEPTVKIINPRTL